MGFYRGTGHLPNCSDQKTRTRGQTGLCSPSEQTLPEPPFISPSCWSDQHRGPEALNHKGTSSRSLGSDRPRQTFTPRARARVGQPIQPPRPVLPPAAYRPPPHPAGDSQGTLWTFRSWLLGELQAGAARRVGRAPLSACPTQLVRNNMLL